MGRFDALTQIENEKTQHTPSPAEFSPTQKLVTKPTPEVRKAVVKKPEIMISRNHENMSPANILKEKPVKYSTLLDAALIKKIKLAAAEKEIKDYEIIEQALTEYFTKHK
jgi:hypothetical protein